MCEGSAHGFEVASVEVNSGGLEGAEDLLGGGVGLLVEGHVQTVGVLAEDRQVLLRKDAVGVEHVATLVEDVGHVVDCDLGSLGHHTVALGEFPHH